MISDAQAESSLLGEAVAAWTASHWPIIRAVEEEPSVGIHVLVVEDEAAIAEFVVRGLREEGFTVEQSGDAKSAWHALRGGVWDVVLLDWCLPGPDGLSLLRRFREIDDRTPVLFLTARDTVADRVHGLDAGADDYLCKPFAFEELLARVRALARRQNASHHSLLSRYGVRIELASQRAERAGNVLDLTAKEYALLLFFLRHPEEVLSRTRIYEQVWDERYDGASNTLEVHVMELRRKLEAHGSRLIHTLRGRGYLFGEASSVHPEKVS
jgi:two-component system copper resistance phosphate regulon response regulator CusR